MGNQKVFVSTPQGSSALWEAFRKDKGYETRADTGRSNHADDAMAYTHNIHVQGRGNAMRFGAEALKKEYIFETDEIKYKAPKMVEQIKHEVKQETLDMAQVTVGKIVFENGSMFLAKFAPKLSWYEKLLTSKEKREVAILVGSYIAIKAAQTKYNHYILDCLSTYLNFEMQQRLVGGLSSDVLEKIFTKLEEK